jgi:hypothetical protein
MTPVVQQSREIDGKGRTIRELLAGRKYSIDYYQREYKWLGKQVSELIDDLAAKFLESYEPGHERDAVATYGHYFLGSIIVSDKDGNKFIIDGQQRLTTLTLLLIFLQHELQDAEQKGQIADLIFSQRFGKRSFNMDIPERADCMEALYTGQETVSNDPSESVTNVIGRYADIDEYFPAELRDDALPYFVDWLIESVHLVEITAYSDGDAYTIFETMNDRGLSLSPADMLKGYLLANITDSDDRVRADKVWKHRTKALQELGKDEDADGIKAWLRSQHADSIREKKRGAKPEDFDLIGTEFHRWVRDHEEPLGLDTSQEFVRFIDRDFAFYGQWYGRLRSASSSLTQGLERLYFNAEHNFTLQYPVLLAPLRVEDSEAELICKIRVTAAYLDILICRRIWNWRAIDYSTMQYAMFLVMKDIRGKDISELISVLRQRLDSETETFLSNDHFRLHGMNGRQIHRLLARMTDFVETESGMPSRMPITRSAEDATASRLSTSGQITTIGTPMSLPIRVISRNTAIGSVTFCSCRRASMRALAIYRTQRSAITTTAKTSWRGVCTRMPTTITLASYALSSRLAYRSVHTPRSSRPISMSGRSFIGCWPSRYGAQTGSKNRRSRARPLDSWLPSRGDGHGGEAGELLEQSALNVGPIPVKGLGLVEHELGEVIDVLAASASN